MYFENAVVPAGERLRSLETSRLHLLDTMSTLRCECADVFADPGRTDAERDDAALELSRVVGEIRRCDDELHALREQAREHLRLVQPARQVQPGWFR